MKYIIVSGYNSDFFSQDVNQLLKEGWKLYGTPYYCHNTGLHCQALTWEEPPKPLEIVDFE